MKKFINMCNEAITSYIREYLSRIDFNITLDYEQNMNK